MVDELRLRLKAYDHAILDVATAHIVEIAKKNNSQVIGPIPLPTRKSVYCVIKSPHKYKDSREQFEMRTHKRMVIVKVPEGNKSFVGDLMKYDVPSEVDIDMKQVFKKDQKSKEDK